MLFTVVEDLTQAFWRKVISDTQQITFMLWLMGTSNWNLFLKVNQSEAHRAVWLH